MKTQERNELPVLNQIAARTGRQIRETAEQFGESAKGVSNRLQAGLDSMGTTFNDVRDSVMDSTKEFSKTANSYVKKNPWAAIGIVAGFAFLAGMFVGRRRDN